MKIKSIFRVWLPFAVVITAFCALAYATVQQALRSGLNDPQIQMAEDGADVLNSGSSVESVVPSQKVFFAKSLAPFVVIYANNGQPVAGSGVLDGQLPAIPQGVLESAKQNGEDRVTWQPNQSVRVAAVVVPYKDGYILAGRNMREVEQRELKTEQYAGAVWLSTLIATFVVIAFGEMMLSEKKAG